MDIGSRESFFDRLRSSIEQQRERQGKLALLVINIRQFRQFNIAHGYAAGDLLLSRFFERLGELSRDNDHIARIGNSDFAMLLPQVLNEGHATLAAIKLLGSLDEPFMIDDQKIRLGASVGIALFRVKSRPSVPAAGISNPTCDRRSTRTSSSSTFNRKSIWTTASFLAPRR
jgi:diguanylate cyclase (GGDEF)-like protein